MGALCPYDLTVHSWGKGSRLGVDQTPGCDCGVEHLLSGLAWSEPEELISPSTWRTLGMGAGPVPAVGSGAPQPGGACCAPGHRSRSESRAPGGAWGAESECWGAGSPRAEHLAVGPGCVSVPCKSSPSHPAPAPVVRTGRARQKSIHHMSAERQLCPNTILGAGDGRCEKVQSYQRFSSPRNSQC